MAVYEDLVSGAVTETPPVSGRVLVADGEEIPEWVSVLLKPAAAPKRQGKADS